MVRALGFISVHLSFRRIKKLIMIVTKFVGFLAAFLAFVDQQGDRDLENYRIEPKLKIALMPYVYIKITYLPKNIEHEFKVVF